MRPELLMALAADVARSRETTTGLGGFSVYQMAINKSPVVVQVSSSIP
jgi:hypothetical protein